MQFRKLPVSLVVALALGTLSGWALPAPTLYALHYQDAPPQRTQTARGKVTTVTDKSFSVEVAKGNDPETLQFIIDKNTQIDGKLEVGVNATVEYRVDETTKKNIAGHVIVNPAQ